MLGLLFIKDRKIDPVKILRKKQAWFLRPHLFVKTNKQFFEFYVLKIL